MVHELNMQCCLLILLLLSLAEVCSAQATAIQTIGDGRDSSRFGVEDEWLAVPHSTLNSARVRRSSYCGDGIVGHDEQCDCGTSRTCTNTCCDPSTCRLAQNATCAHGECCDLTLCSVKSVSTLCRAATSECDLPEHCSGWSPNCPKDVHKLDSTPCHGGQGHCHAGSCGSRDLLCQSLYGKWSSEAAADCYEDLNTRGTRSGHCGGAGQRSFRACDQQSSMCGVLFCQVDQTVGSSSPTCHSTPSPTTNRPGNMVMVPDGATCGPCKMCMSHSCVDVEDVSECGGDCNGRGVCNSEGSCHCVPGYAPPNCTQPGYGGSIHSGHITDPLAPTYSNVYLAVCFLLVIPMIVMFCIMFVILNVQWESKHLNDTSMDKTNYGILSKCCCLSKQVVASLTKLDLLSDILSPEEEEMISEKLTKEEYLRRNTVCTVDVNVIAPPPQPNSWGVAHDKLMTDIITVSPQSSPAMSRKIRLPPNSSPVLHHRSQESVHRPPYKKSFSADSGCVSDMEEGKVNNSKNINLSMGSLVSVVMKMGKKKTSNENNNEIDHPKHVHQKKPVPLSRIVLDPYSSSKRHSKPDFESQSFLKPPVFQRSISTDGTKEKNNCWQPIAPAQSCASSASSKSSSNDSFDGTRNKKNLMANNKGNTNIGTTTKLLSNSCQRLPMMPNNNLLIKPTLSNSAHELNIPSKPKKIARIPPQFASEKLVIVSEKQSDEVNVENMKSNLKQINKPGKESGSDKLVTVDNLRRNLKPVNRPVDDVTPSSSKNGKGKKKVAMMPPI